MSIQESQAAVDAMIDMQADGIDVEMYFDIETTSL